MFRTFRPALRAAWPSLPLVWWPQQTVQSTALSTLPTPRLDVIRRARALVRAAAQFPCAAVFLTGCDEAFAAAIQSAAASDAADGAKTAASQAATACRILGRLDAARGMGTSIVLAGCGDTSAPCAWTTHPVAPAVRGGGSGGIYVEFRRPDAAAPGHGVVVAFADVSGYRAAAAGLQAGRAWAPEPRSFRVRAAPGDESDVVTGNALPAFPVTGAQRGQRRRNDSALDMILGASGATAAVVASGGRFGFSPATWSVNALLGDDTVGPLASFDAPEAVLGADATAFYNFPSCGGSASTGMSDWIDAARAGEAAVATAERTAQGDELNGSTATPSGTRVLSALKDLERDPCRVLVRRPEAAYVGVTVAHSGLVSFRSATSHRVISGVGIRLRNQSSPTFVALSPHRPVLIQIE